MGTLVNECKTFSFFNVWNLTFVNPNSICFDLDNSFAISSTKGRHFCDEKA
jgi:hypothetical protein